MTPETATAAATADRRPDGAVDATSAAPVLEIHDLTVAYHRKPVLWDVDARSTAPAWPGSSGRTGPARAP